ncbi:MAG: DUF6282 family protein, partial [Nocardioidaceae bacterium]
ERASAVGRGAVGGIVLNSAVGGANPDAVEVAARLGGRVVWMPTVSSATHKAGESNPELRVHQGFELSLVPVFEDRRLLGRWHDVLDVVAEHDLVLASGHLSADETCSLFAEASRRGVERLLVNHPMMAFLGWNEEARRLLLSVDARLELAILPDILGGAAHSSMSLLEQYPHELLVFGADLGHAHYPSPAQAIPTWLRDLERRAGEDAAKAIVSTNGRTLLGLPEPPPDDRWSGAPAARDVAADLANPKMGGRT